MFVFLSIYSSLKTYHFFSLFNVPLSYKLFYLFVLPEIGIQKNLHNIVILFIRTIEYEMKSKFEWQSFGCLFIFRTNHHMCVLAYSATEQLLRLAPGSHYEQMDSLNCRIYQSTCRCVFYYCQIYSRVLCAFYKSIAAHVVRLPHVFYGSFLRVPNDII